MTWFFIIILCVLVLLLTYANRVEPNKMVESLHYSVKNDKIKEPVKILQLSDLHLYRNMPRKRLNNMKTMLQSVIALKKPDIIFITGDMVDSNSGIELLPDVLRLLKARYGVYAVMGNHDYYEYNVLHLFSPAMESFERKMIDTRGLKRVLKDQKVRLLVDEQKTLMLNGNRVDIIGIDTDTFKKKEIGKFRLKKTGNYKILLSHYPDVIHHFMGKVDLVLSGHTHGGQVTLFGFPLVTKTSIKRSGVKGVSLYKNTVLIVSKGMGVSRYFPIRFFAKPDIHFINIGG